MSRVSAAAALVLALAGCATTAKYQATLNTWIGEPEHELVQSWGIPDGSYESGGFKYLTYASAHSFYVQPNPGYVGSNVHRSCKTVFSVRDGRIESWSYEGNNCRSR